jgi:hypothetical protein
MKMQFVLCDVSCQIYVTRVHILTVTRQLGPGGSVVDVVATLRAGRSGVQIQAGVETFSSSCRPHMLWGQNSLMQWVPRFFSWG